ncbi:hypothetical protein K456DRAFT_1715303 [Colletotrichum gloeosporioides 23]|nr:hypothetical protein K456DRAFT_1715303 [Colletotrichum gloeosporioides 23]
MQPPSRAFRSWQSVVFFAVYTTGALRWQVFSSGYDATEHDIGYRQLFSGVRIAVPGQVGCAARPSNLSSKGNKQSGFSAREGIFPIRLLIHDLSCHTQTPQSTLDPR